MSRYSTVFKIEAQAELRKIPRGQAMTVLRKLAELESDPYAFGTTPLVGIPGHRRLRVGDYRVIYTVDNGELVIVVVEVGHRSSVYD
ncbi:type II toxin-antitoxin system RelE/ParE family toxin [Nocardiopsis dassonvillei]|uniref:type II toxin-antitoxin system RelE family toxin n=1 Tax=Nocardiopsis TaxID=2013 RepID=UPI00200F9E85|nr:type II toxin-antitoxin system RelE/ParE family toxin [Nocardiopsis dassonvillei]MCK9873169.1 type II toxin-antitoxin system RelE/ParE family toxin [Nocardiopsis dassonvillei]